VTPYEAIQQARAGQLLPIYVVAGEERLVRDEVVAEIRKAALEGGAAAFNEDKFTAGEADVESIVTAALTVPMMAKRRFVLVRGAERWDGAEASVPFDRLTEYAASPVPSTCLVVIATKIDGRRKLAVAARKQGFFVACDPLDARALVPWIVERTRLKGHAIERELAELLAALAGPDLSSLDDAIERLSLYARPGQPIDERAIGECVARVRLADTWALVDAVGARDLGRALRTLADAYDPRDRGLPLLGALAWSVRQLARYQAEIAAGAAPDAAAKRAGVFVPYRARELANKARAVAAKEVERWLLVVAETDLALKGSRRPPESVLEDMVMRLCHVTGLPTRPRGRAGGTPPMPSAQDPGNRVGRAASNP
jgi:DNA polymerase-3 subunit delta